jgi:hypothetical protein
MKNRISELTLETRAGRSPLTLRIDRLIVAGWVGKDKRALQEHIEELGKMGVAAPSRTPTYMNLSPALLTTSDDVDVVGPESSGEVECVLIKDVDKIYMGVGSDHTDRDFEKYGIPASKQMCAKPLATVVWDLEEVKDHLEDILMRSWMTLRGRRSLYQEGRLGDNLSVLEILDGIPVEDGMGLDRFCLFCGTFPAKGGISMGERFEFEMEDPVLGRKIGHAYQVRCMPQYL